MASCFLTSKEVIYFINHSGPVVLKRVPLGSPTEKFFKEGKSCGKNCFSWEEKLWMKKP